MAASAGVVLAGGRSSRMGVPKAALEWHGSTLLARTVGILARATGGPVVVVRASGQDLPELPKRTVVVDDRRDGKGPVEGIAAGLAALDGLADAAFICSTDLPFLHPAFIRRVLRTLDQREETDVALPVARGYPQPLAAAYRVRLAPLAERLVKEDRLRPAFLFDECAVERLDEQRALGGHDAADRGHDAVHATDLGLHSATDAGIMARAKLEARTVITADLDYPHLLALAGATEPSVILFRGGDWSEADVTARMREVLASLTEAEIAQSIVVVDRNRLRRRRLPIGE